MPKAKTSQRGIVLFLVLGLSILLFIGLLGLFFLLTANIRNLEAFKERAEAYYVCETGASLAISQGVCGQAQTAYPSLVTGTLPYSFDYTIEDHTYTKSYTINYIAEWASGVCTVKSSVGPLSGFKRTYTLEVKGQRAFPIFTRGFPGK